MKRSAFVLTLLMMLTSLQSWAVVSPVVEHCQHDSVNSLLMDTSVAEAICDMDAPTCQMSASSCQSMSTVAAVFMAFYEPVPFFQVNKTDYTFHLTSYIAPPALIPPIV